jgi:hypothetical protein
VAGVAGVRGRGTTIGANGSLRRAAGIWLVMLTAALAWVVYLVVQQGHSWTDMDLDSDGITTISELLDSIDVGRRPITMDGHACVEMFAYKDGMPVKTVCP